MDITFNVSLGAMVTIVIFALSLAAGWGSIFAQIKGVNRRLDTINGRLDSQGVTQSEQGERIARIEGVF